MNTFMNGLQNATNYKLTENGELAHSSTLSGIMDLFALGGAYRKRSDDDCILLFKNAFKEDRLLALKTLFYLRDVRGGQGERRFFRVCFHWLAKNYPDIARKNLDNVSEFGRWDDLIYTTAGTYIWDSTMAIVKHQLALDVECKTPSLLAKWLPSENASSQTTKITANIIREYLGMTHKEYRKMLSILRDRINVLEKLMSSNQWDKIEFDKIPSKAGLIYRNAFARRDIIAKKYEAFVKDKNTKVNAQALYPYEIVGEAVKKMSGSWYSDWHSDNITDTDRAMLDKYWENQKDVLNGAPLNMLCVVDTSGSMHGTDKMAPINVAIGLGMYCAERAGGPFHNHYISFSSRPQLINVEGVDFYDKVKRIYRTNLCEDTNLEAVFNLLYNTALHARPEDIPSQIVVISDMEINRMTCGNWCNEGRILTGMEAMRKKWAAAGLKLPKLVYWNVNARNSTFLDLGPDVSYVSGASVENFKAIITGKTGWELVMEVIDSERYKNVTI